MIRYYNIKIENYALAWLALKSLSAQVFLKHSHASIFTPFKPQ
ncbi:hypothetical protein N205_05495 [Helicobacter pylori UM077]|nr:hypothetical protein N205_05495 [Helicobacter pylori UM077]